jgi:uncharacterized membrane protein YdfJ with MMPL/SSD domain
LGDGKIGSGSIIDAEKRLDGFSIATARQKSRVGRMIEKRPAATALASLLILLATAAASSSILGALAFTEGPQKKTI